MKNNITHPIFYVIVLGWIALCYLILVSSVQSIVSPLSDSQKANISFFFPEGWGFFTKNPRDEILTDIYKIENGKLNLVTIPNSSSENLLGFSRKSRFISAEATKLSVLVGENGWQNSVNWIEHKILPKNKNKVILPPVLKSQLRYFKSGEYLLVRYKITPWAWTTKNQERFNLFFIKRITI
jgi:antimicrobial peptide system SdpA family protein